MILNNFWLHLLDIAPNLLALNKERVNAVV
jgi:hypothetical protein